MMRKTASIVIPSHNRRTILQRTCYELARLNPPADEIIVCLDGCTDGSRQMLATEFPDVVVLENEKQQGSIPSRDRAFRQAVGDIIITLDDDSYPIDVDFISRVCDVFASKPEMAVVSFPELRDDGSFAAANQTSASQGHHVSAYADCAAALRRESYLQLPGFPGFFGHMYEEPDYALQCYAAGSAVWFEPTLTVRHHQCDANREPRRRHQLNARNELWSVWLRCPWPWLPLVSIYRVWRQFRYACSVGPRWAASEPVWWLAAIGGMPRCWRHRRPVKWSVYYRWMRLARDPIVSPSDVHPAPSIAVVSTISIS
jgi:GT2 family glycosyltransferase